jgi:hypothetical protein
VLVQVNPLEELRIPELTTEQIEQLCDLAENAANEYVLSKVSPKKIETLNITAEVEGTKPVTLTVDVDIVLSDTMKDYDVQKLVNEAVKQAFKTAEKYLKGLTCHSPK